MHANAGCGVWVSTDRVGVFTVRRRMWLIMHRRSDLSAAIGVQNVGSQ